MYWIILLRNKFSRISKPTEPLVDNSVHGLSDGENLHHRLGPFSWSIKRWSQALRLFSFIAKLINADPLVGQQ
jgi:hypothetical protein